MTRELTPIETLFLALDADIRDRKGIGNEWEMIDGEIMLGEIKPAWERIIGGAIDAADRAGFARGVEAAVRVCLEWRDQYPTDIFFDSHGPARMARHVCTGIEKDIRALLPAAAEGETA
jgi:hypothetical protein